MNLSFKNWLSCSLAFLLLSLAAALHAEEVVSNGLVFDVEDGQATVIGLEDSTITEINIPAEVKGCPVTAIGEYAFQGRVRLASVSIPDSVEEIREDAFYGDMTLQFISIGTGVSDVYFSAFDYCERLRYVQTDNEYVKEWFAENMPYVIVIGMNEEPPKEPYVTVVDGIRYRVHVTKGEVNVIGPVSRKINNAVIVDEVDGYPVVGIAMDADEVWGFEYCFHLESVTLPKGLKYIGDEAFQYCHSLASVNLPEGLEIIYYGAFLGCTSLTSINIPASVEEISDAAFAECENLCSIDVAAGNETYASLDGVLYDREFTTLVICPPGKTTLTLPATVKSLSDDEEFGYYHYTLGGGCNLKAIEVDAANESFASQDGVLYTKDMKKLVFYPAGKDSKSFTLPATVTEIGNGALSCSQSKEILVEDGNAYFTVVDGVLYTKDMKELVFYPRGLTNAHFKVPDSVASMYIDNDYLVRVVVGNEENDYDDGHNYIGGKRLTYLETNNETAAEMLQNDKKVSVIGMGDWNEWLDPSEKPKFRIQDGLLFRIMNEEAAVIGVEDWEMTDVVIPEQVDGCPVTFVDDYDPHYLTIMHSVGIPSTLAERYIYPATRQWFERWEVAEGNPSYSSKDGVLFSADGTVLYCYPQAKAGVSYTIPNGCRTIESDAFHRALYLERLVIPDSVEFIGDYAMGEGSFALRTLVVGDGVTEIGDCAFEYEDTLETVYTDNKYVAEWFAKHMPKAEVLSLAYDTTVDGINYHIEGGEAKVVGVTSKRITEVVIPDEVDGYPVIGIGHSYDYDGEEGGAEPFEYCFHLESVTLPKGLKYIGEEAFQYCRSLASVNLPEGLEIIDYEAFCGCTSLTSINIPASVEAINGNVFEGCEKLSSIDVAEANETYASLDGVVYDKEFTVLFICPAGKDTLTLPATVKTLNTDDYFDYGDYEEDYDDAYLLSGYCYNLKAIEVDAANESFASQDGVLYTKDMKKLVFYPTAKESDSFTVPATVTEIGEYAISNAPVKEFLIGKGSKSFTSQDGVLYTADMETLVCYPRKREATVFTVPETVSSIDIGYPDYLLGIVIPNADTEFDRVELWSSRLAFVQTDNEAVKESLNDHYYYYYYEFEPTVTLIGMDDQMPEMRLAMQNGLLFRIMDGEAAVIGVEDWEMTDVVVPETVDGCPVTSIEGGEIQYIAIMHSLSIPSTLGALAHDLDSYGEYIMVPATRQWFERWEVAEGNPAYSSRNGVLFSADGGTVLHYPPARPGAVYAIPDGCKVISRDVFQEALYLETLVIPDSVETIGDWAFGDDGGFVLREIVIGNGVAEIGECVFEDEEVLETVYTDNEYVAEWFEENCPEVQVLGMDQAPSVQPHDTVIDGIIYHVEGGEATVIGVEDDSIASVAIPSEVDGGPVTAIAAWAFAGCDKLQKVVLPATITGFEYDPEDSFEYCPGLTNIIVSEENEHYASFDGVLYSKDLSVLYCCPQGRSGVFTVPAGVTEIYADAFEHCGVERIALPSSVSEIHRYSFYCCFDLVGFDVADGNEDYKVIDGVLYDADVTEIVCYPAGRPGAVFAVPATVLTISEEAFADACHLVGLEIGDSLEEIEEYGIKDGDVFYVQTDNPFVREWLEENAPEVVVVGKGEEPPQAVTVDGIIYCIHEGEAVAVKATDKEVVAVALQDRVAGCPVTKLSGELFAWCEKLREASIGDAVEEIGEYAFEDCNALETVYTDNEYVKEWFADFEDVTALPMSDWKQFVDIDLASGWNFIGIPFVLDDGSLEKLGGYDTFVYALDKDCYVRVNSDYSPGSAIWLFAPEAAKLTLRGTSVETTGVALNAGWNLVAPLYGTDGMAALPEGVTEGFGWRKGLMHRLSAGELAVPGKAYWLKAPASQVIWAK